MESVLDQYLLSEREPVLLLRESSDNEVYLIGTTEKKILRVSKHLPVDDIQFEFEVLEHLKKNGFPVPTWLKTKDNKVSASTEDGRVVVVFGFINGYHAVSETSENPNEDQVFSAGKALAGIAKIGQDFSPTTHRTRTIFSELERAIKHADIFRKEFKGGGEFIQEVESVLEFAKNDTSPKSIIHNDYRPGNVFFENDTQVSGVVDFDWSCVGPIVKDLALGALEWSFKDKGMTPDFERFDLFLKGYNEVLGTNYKRGQELYSWIMFAALSDTVTYFCDRLSNPELKRDVSTSFMYRKYLYFSEIRNK